MSDRVKIYYLFSGENYYPAGGMSDYVCSGTLEHCREVAHKLQAEPRTGWWHIAVDNTIVEEWDR